MISLDLIAASLCGAIALFLFSLHVVSSPLRKAWVPLPEYVRGGFLLGGAMFMWRSVNFVSIAPEPMLIRGHINAEGILTTIVLAYIFGSCAFCYWRFSFRDKQVDRLTFAAKQAQRNERMVPLVMDRDEVAMTAISQGIHVNADGVTSEFHFAGEDNDIN